MPEPNRNRRLKKRKTISDSDLTDLSDGLDVGEWRSRYNDPEPRRRIRVEAIYLAALLILTPAFMLILWLDYPKNWLRLTDERYKPILKYGLAWLSGVLGGTLFDMKWLYRSVARGFWHIDRRLWRLFAPHISGGLAFAVVALIASGMLRVFDRQAPDSLSVVVGVSFMVGYFSDSAVAKLAEIAETLFGLSRAKEKHVDELPSKNKTSTTDEISTGEQQQTPDLTSGASSESPQNDAD